MNLFQKKPISSTLLSRTPKKKEYARFNNKWTEKNEFPSEAISIKDLN